MGGGESFEEVEMHGMFQTADMYIEIICPLPSYACKVFFIVHALAEFIRKKCCICFKASCLLEHEQQLLRTCMSSRALQLLLKSYTCTW